MPYAEDLMRIYVASMLLSLFCGGAYACPDALVKDPSKCGFDASQKLQPMVTLPPTNNGANREGEVKLLNQ